MTNKIIKPTLGKKIVLGVVGVGVVVIFLTSLVYRFTNPEMQKTMRQQDVAQAPAGMEGAEGMMNMDQVREMLDALEERISTNPNDIEALLQAANIFIMRQDKAKALEYMKRAGESTEASLDVFMQLSKLYYDLGEFELAIGSIDSILETDPDNMFAHFNRGVVLKYRLERPKEAEVEFRLVVESEHEIEDLRVAAQKEIQ